MQGYNEAKCGGNASAALQSGGNVSEGGLHLIALGTATIMSSMQCCFLSNFPIMFHKHFVPTTQ